jgi:hypothetical protein
VKALKSVAILAQDYEVFSGPPVHAGPVLSVMADEAADESRNSWRGNAADMANILRPFAIADGVSLCTYTCEATTVSKAVLDIASVGKNGALLEALHAVQENLSFKKLTMEQALKQLVDDGTIAAVKKQNVKAFVVVLANRIRNMCRVVSQALTKADPPKWTEHLPWLAEACEGEETPAAKRQRISCKTSPGQDKLMECKSIYAFDEETMLCTRQSMQGGPLTMSLPLKLSDVAGDTVKAKFIDDEVLRAVPGLSTKRLSLMLASRSGSSSVGPLWTGNQIGTKHKITVHQKVDRHLLLVMFEQTRQVCQLRLDSFGPLSDQAQQLPREHESIVQGLKILVPIAERFCAGELVRDDLKAARDQAMSGTASGSASVPRPKAKVGDPQPRPKAKGEKQTKTAAAEATTTKAAIDAKKRPAAASATATPTPKAATPKAATPKAATPKVATPKAATPKYEDLQPPPSTFLYETLSISNMMD